MTLRVTLDLEVEEGDMEAINKALVGGSLNKTLGNYVAYVTIPNLPNIKGRIKVTPVGGYCHVHDGSPFDPCDKCVALAGTPLYKKYPASA